MGTGVVQYDAAGNVVRDNLNQYLYDGEGRLCAVQNLLVGAMTQYIYDADGRRVAKGSISSWSCDLNINSTTGKPNNGFTPSNLYVIGPSGEQLTETDGQGNWLHTNVYAAGSLIATYDMAPTGDLALHFQLEDWLGTRRVQTDIAGNVEETYASMPYGDGLTPSMPTGAPPTADDATENHFTGKEWDYESGNDYFGARYYSSAMGRWMSADPSGLLFADQGNPQSFNLYGYVRNNPTNSIDTDGLLTIVIPGTWWTAQDWNYQNHLVEEASARFHEQHQTWLDQWDPRGNNDRDRSNAARGLRYFINHYHFAPGERLSIVAHSHGGNIALQAAALGLNHRIDTLITLGTPFGYGSMTAGVGQWYNVTGSGDDVQPMASQDCEPGSCDTQQGAHNYTVQASGHTSLWKDDQVRALWWNWFTNQSQSGGSTGSGSNSTDKTWDGCKDGHAPGDC